LAPLIETGTLLAEPARPQPVDEHPLAVAGFRRVVDPPDLHMRCMRHEVPPPSFIFLDSPCVPQVRTRLSVTDSTPVGPAASSNLSRSESRTRTVSCGF